MIRCLPDIAFSLALLISAATLAGAEAAPIEIDKMSTHGATESAPHWSRPVMVGHSVAGLTSGECSACHPGKVREWSASLHAKSFSPGLSTQLHPLTDPEFAYSCYKCHAPALIQSEIRANTDTGGGYEKNPFFNEELQKAGVTCVACHMRSGTINGPVKPAAGALEGLHSTVMNPLFTSSTFCAACHQLDNGFVLNGKPLVNTFTEWRESTYGERGVTCQDCHMPERRHLFKGIHDPETTKSAVDFKLVKREGSVTLRITNTGAGHYFPTYITPMVVVRGRLTGRDGGVIKDSEKVERIVRKLPLDLSREEYDTRILPRESFDFKYSLPAGGTKGKKLLIDVTVYPDEFYNRFYRAATDNDWPNFKKEELKEALRLSEESPYILYSTEVEF